MALTGGAVASTTRAGKAQYLRLQSQSYSHIMSSVSMYSILVIPFVAASVAARRRTYLIYCKILDELVETDHLHECEDVMVQAGKAQDLPVYFGDAGSPGVLHSIGAHKAACAVITLDAPGALPPLPPLGPDTPTKLAPHAFGAWDAAGTSS